MMLGKLIKYIFILLLTLVFFTKETMAQGSCKFTVYLHDLELSGGGPFNNKEDGWEGANLKIYVNGTLKGTHTLQNSEYYASYSFTANPGDEIIADYKGAGPNKDKENEYLIADKYGYSLVHSGASGTAPEDHTFTAPDCSVSPWNDFVKANFIGTECTSKKVKNATFSGNPFSIASINTSNTDLKFDSCILLSSGIARDVFRDAKYLGYSELNETGSPDSDLNLLLRGSGLTKAATILEFDFTPQTKSISFNYIFASEEYPKHIDGPYNDIFGFLLTGPDPNGGEYTKKNIAIIPGTTSAVSIKNINHKKNSHLYINNVGGQNISYNGYTTPFIATADVVPCQEYHIKLAIADVGDTKFDSGVFLESGSFKDGFPVEAVNNIPELDNVGVNYTKESCDNFFIFQRLDTLDLRGELSINVTVEAISSDLILGEDISLTRDTLVTIPAGVISDTLVYTAFMDNLDEDVESFRFLLPINGCPCEPINDTVIIYIEDIVPLNASISKDTLISSGNQVNFSVDVNPDLKDPVEYYWNELDSITSSIIDTPAVGLNIYTVDVGVPGCQNAQLTVNAIVIASEDIPIVYPEFVCLYEDVTIAYNEELYTEHYKYKWRIDDIDSVNTDTVKAMWTVPGDKICSFEVERIDGGYDVFDSVFTIHVYDPLIAKLSVDTFACFGDPIVINIDTLGGGMGAPYTITVDELGDVTDADFPYSMKAETLGYNTFHVNIKDGCTTPEINDLLKVNVIVLPIADFATDKVEGCQPYWVKHTPVTIEENHLYMWDFGDRKSSRDTIAYHFYEDYGTFKANLSLKKLDQYGCIGRDTVEILVHPKPVVNFTISPNHISILNTEVYFENHSQFDNLNYWFYGDQDSTLMRSFSHTYDPIPGNHYVKLVAVSDHNCIDSLTKVLKIEDVNSLYVPNAFTPNGDGDNDEFYILGNGISEEDFQFIIYDRWGEIIFKTETFDADKGKSEGWDGKVRGKQISASGVYTWVVIYKDTYRKYYKKIGAVTLIR